jgi:hypothetical protein
MDAVIGERVIAQQELDQGGFPAARRTNDGQSLPARDGQAEILDHRGAFAGIGEGQVVEADGGSACAAVHWKGLTGGAFGGLVHQLEDAPRAAGGLVDRRQVAGDR